jgi:hypothetical protein
VKKVLEDLKSPELRHLLVAGGQVAMDSAKLLKSTADMLEDAGDACEGNPLAIAKCGAAMVEVGLSSVELLEHSKDLKAANTPEARAKLQGFVRDLKTLMASTTKLQYDTARFWGAAPSRVLKGGV